MTTKSWAFATDHQSDAGFRAWVADFIVALTDVGLVQTADTGQINTATVARPSANSDGGYAVFTWADSLQGSAPIFIRFNFGTGGAATRPRIMFVMGTGSNGSGTITGTALTSTIGCYTNAATATGVSYQNFMCHTEGFFGFAWNVNSAATNFARGALFICRTADADGVPTVDGATLLADNALTNLSQLGTVQSLRFASTAAAYVQNTAPCILVPANEASSLVGADTQAYIAWGINPAVYPLFGLCSVYVAEVAEFATFSATLFGLSAHTYISFGREAGTYWAANTAPSHSLCMLWE
jgi:hypothetical protein